ncbi:MAG: hypothetical protein U5K77_01070 [Candidatus Saccharibacteria bacterium]|nr:hypothetical protein [Candidatus Saccharibacteria bacterium]
MNEQQGESYPQTELPKPQTGEFDSSAEQINTPNEQKMSQSVETTSTQTPSSQPQQGTQVQPTSDHTNPASDNDNSAANDQPDPSTPPIADDVDLIEKEWVHKAKEIVEHTKDDPYKQNQQMNQVRADYLKKRYNKEIKPVDD